MVSEYTGVTGYPNGVGVEAWTTYDTPSGYGETGPPYRVRTGTGETWEFDDFVDARLWAGAVSAAGGEMPPTPDPEYIPVRLMNGGRIAVAAYLRVAHGFSVDEVAQTMEISPRTVEQYYERVKDNDLTW